MGNKGFFRRLFSSPQKTASSNISTWIISYPKSGRTWLRVLIGRILTQHHGLDEKWMLDERSLTVAAGLPAADFSHDETSNSDGRRLQDLSTDKSRFKGKRVLLLVRDPRDVVVSCFFQATRRKSRFQGNLHDFVHSDTHGIRKIIHFYQIWHGNQDVPAEFLLLRYEDLRDEPITWTQRVLQFLGAHDVPVQTIQEAVEYSSFDRMKEMERTNSLNNKKLKAGNQNDPESFKVRKGKVGGFVDYLSPEDIAFCNSVIVDMPSPFGYREQVQDELKVARS